MSTEIRCKPGEDASEELFKCTSKEQPLAPVEDFSRSRWGEMSAVVVSGLRAGEAICGVLPKERVF